MTLDDLLLDGLRNTARATTAQSLRLSLEVKCFEEYWPNRTGTMLELHTGPINRVIVRHLAPPHPWIPRGHATLDVRYGIAYVTCPFVLPLGEGRTEAIRDLLAYLNQLVDE